MKQVGVVTEIRDGYAAVLVAQTSMCGENCGACKGGCKPGTQKVLAKIDCAQAVRAGDQVSLELDSKKVLAMAAVLYVLPVLALFAAYFIAEHFFYSEPIRIVSAFAAAIFVFFFVKLFDNALKNSKKYEIRVVKVLH